MELQMIAISSEKREIYEKLVGELSRFKQKGEPRFFEDDESASFKYYTLVVATPEEAKLIRENLNKMKKELDEEYRVNARYC